MAQIVHGECAIGGGGGGGAIPPETQALGTPSHLPVPGRLSRLSATPLHAPRLQTMPLIRPWLYFWKFLFSLGSLLIVYFAAAAASIEFARRIDSVDINATPTGAKDTASAGHHGWAFLYGLMIQIVRGSLRWLLPFSFLYFSHILGSSIILIVQSGYLYLNRKLVTVVSYLGVGFLLLALVLFAAIHMSSDDSLAMTHGSEIKTLNYHKHSHDRELLSFSHDTHADGSGQDQKALPQWTTNLNSNHSAEEYEEKREMRNGHGKPHRSKHEIIVIVVVSCTAVVVVYCIVLLLRCYRVKRAQQGLLVQRELCRLTGSKAFQYDVLAAATNNFDQENKLGQGGFGPVYRGFLRDSDRHVAIKLLSAESSSQGQREFEAEVEVLTQVSHRNIVQLIGWCQSKQGLLLVYELMAQGSLDMHLHNPDRNLSWQQRYKITLDLGSALLYLHRCCEKCIVHGDIKPQNVMLDASFNAKLGDFGTARLVQHGADPRTTQIVAGTPGYIDPDFINSRLRCPEADIYSFGVALLEIASGKRPASRLPIEARSLYDRHMILDAADVKMNGNFDRQQMRHVLVTGLWCTHQDPSQRPSIEQAMDVLRCVDAKLPVLPATRDAQQVRFLEEQAYRDLTAEGASVDVVAASTCYHTSKNSAYLLAEK